MNFDAVVTGARGKHRIADFILGSTAIHLVRKSSIPLFIVN
jgi:nucleotide-binding universal stress UspA family protein